MSDINSVDDGLPERFIYVCIATARGLPNVAPIWQLGRERVAGLIVIEGVADRRSPTPADWREAIRPAIYLEKMAREHLPAVSNRIIRLDGHPDSFADWASIAQKVIEQAGAWELPLVINLSGGTKQTGHGLKHFLEPSFQSGDAFIFFGKYPGHVLAIVQTEGGLEEIRIDASRQMVPIDVQLGAHGVELRSEDDDGAGVRALFGQHPAWPGQVLDRLIDTNRKGSRYKPGAIGRLSRINGRIPDDNHKPFDLRGEMAHVQALFDPGRAIWPSGIPAVGTVVTDPVVRAVITGRWLEWAIYMQLKAKLGGRPGVELVYSQPFAVAGSAVKGDDDGEIDIWVRIGNQLHLIEVKCGTSPKRLGQYSNTLSARKAKIAGRPDEAWLVAPFVCWHRDPEKARHIRRETELRVQSEGAALLTGPEAIDRLATALTRLAKTYADAQAGR